ncbi:cytochrome c family protein [Acetobacteraceae bacterium H6797]|nr:cytochrome c family protein [Acetobacteraceae bacterium H6797]
MSLEANKVLSAILTAGIAFSVAGVIGDFAIHPKRLHEPAITIPGLPAEQAPAAAAAETIEPVTPLLANANADNGRTLAQRQCGACHTFNEGGRSGVGPNLYGIIGQPHGHLDGFNYSAAMKAKHGEAWDYEKINIFLAGPAKAIPGTKMTFAGLRQAGQRADVIAFLRSISPSAPPP